MSRTGGGEEGEDWRKRNWETGGRGGEEEDRKRGGEDEEEERRRGRGEGDDPVRRNSPQSDQTGESFLLTGGFRNYSCEVCEFRVSAGETCDSFY